MAAPIWAISFTGAKQSSRAISESWRVAGMASGGRGPSSRYLPTSSTRMPASSTALVSSSTNSGLPSVLTTICSVTSGGGMRPPVTRTIMLWTLERSSRPSDKVLTLGRPTHGGSNSGRKVNSASTGSWRTRSTVRSSSSRVLEREQDRLPASETLELIEQCRQRSAALLRGAERQRRIALTERDRQQCSKKRRYSFNPRCAHGEERFQLVEALLGPIVCFERRRSLQLGDERTKRAVGVVRRALVTQARMRLADDARSESRCNARLADPRLARDQHDLPLALPGKALAFQQEIDLLVAADEISQTRRADRLEAALGIGYALHHPRCDRLGNTLDLVPAEVA